MSLFSGITDAYKKSEAAVVVQNLLEHQARVGLLDADPRELANRLVSLVWDAKPDMFGGKFGQRPHKLSVAAAALANGFNQFNDDLNQGALLIALGNLLTKLEINGHLYSLNVIDHTLIGAAASIFVETFGQHDTTDQPQRQSDKSNYSSFDAWYAEFKAAAGKANPRLRQTSVRLR